MLGEHSKYLGYTWDTYYLISCCIKLNRTILNHVLLTYIIIFHIYIIYYILMRVRVWCVTQPVVSAQRPQRRQLMRSSEFDAGIISGKKKDLPVDVYLMELVC